MLSRQTFPQQMFFLWRDPGQGLGKWLISCILAHTEMQGLRKWTQNTKDAHGLYDQVGFRQNTETDTYMVNRSQSQEEEFAE